MSRQSDESGGPASALQYFFLADVVLLSPPYGTLTYALPTCLPREAWEIGMRAAVPLGKGTRAAVVLDVRAKDEGEAPPPGLKAARWPLERSSLLTSEYIDLARQLSLRQATPLGRILGSVLPLPLRSGKARIRFLSGGKGKDFAVSAMPPLDADARKACVDAWMRGDAVCLGNVDDPMENEACVLAHDPPWPIRPRAVRQLEVLEYLYSRGSVSRRRLTADLGAHGSAALAVLAERGLVRIRAVEEPAAVVESPERASWSAPFALTADQRKALAAFTVCLDKKEAATHLLHGVTGSGKSVVYMALAAECLARGLSAMLLAPEVALAHKLFADVEAHLPNAPVFLYHGYQTAKQRDHTFRAVAARTAPCLIVGTRSALFLPVRGLGAVVLDEEHDGSFKQDEGLPYQAKEVAWYRAGREKALLVLGSATPDVKTYRAAKEGLFPLHELPERVGGGALPAVRLVAMPRGLGVNSAEGGVLAPESVDALAACVDRGDQAVILLNRRGYAPLMYCLSCGESLKCPECAISLTYHKMRERAVCHYCGHAVPYPTPCPACGGLHFLPMGEGTEKLEESLAPRLKTGTRILRLDRDSTRRPGAMESILNAFARGEAQVLVGTQMLSKGHHFPDVTLVVAADADLGLNLPDYRAAERTFQLLVQASGRAGRGIKAGEVLVQTRDPAHYCWEFVKTGDYAGFYAQEIARRERRRYPPFVRLALLRMSFAKDSARGAELMEETADAIRAYAREIGLTVLGPAPAPIAYLRGMRRFHCLIKADAWGPVRELFAAAWKKAGNSNTLKLSLDLDPVNML